MIAMADGKSYLEERQPRFLDELLDFLRTQHLRPARARLTSAAPPRGAPGGCQGSGGGGNAPHHPRD